MKYLTPFFLALSLLTRIPIPASVFSHGITEKEQSRSVLYYPVIGLVIGAILTLLIWLLRNDLTLQLKASLLLVSWVVLTGALHLDGLADSVDAAYASHKDIEVTLEVFRDPRAGSMAVVSIVLVLILKLSLLTELMDSPKTLMLVIVVATALSRLSAVYYMLFTRYVRKGGMVPNIKMGHYRFPITLISGVLIFTTALVTSFLAAGTIVLLLILFLVFWRQYWINKIDGYTGDCVGALIEVSETLVLFVAVILGTFGWLEC